MLCEKCGMNTANIFLSQTINGKKSEMHVCSKCAAQMGYFGDGMNLSLDLLGAFSPALKTVKSCPVCGKTYEQIKKSQRFGCEECYVHFSNITDGVLERIHGKTLHTGKLPDKVDAKLKTKRHLDDLKRKLKEAVLNEKYEDAAKFRDEIKSIEEGL